MSSSSAAPSSVERSTPPGRRLPGRQPLGIAPEDDVDASPGHVGGHGHPTDPAGLGDDLRLTEVLLGVEDLVGYALLLEEPGEVLGLGHRGGAHQHRLALVVALDDVIDHGGELGVLRLVDEVGLVVADQRHVRRDGDDREVVGVGELRCLGLCGTGHPGQLLVQPEVVLEGDRRPGVVLLFDPHPLLGLDRLVQSVRPPPAVEGAPGELVDDLDLALGHQVVLVPAVQLLGQERLGEVVDVVDRHRVVQVAHAQLASRPFRCRPRWVRRCASPRPPRSRPRPEASARSRRIDSRAGPTRQPGPR